jgi:hypothetical protein
LIGKAASDASFAALHKGSIMVLVVVGICDFREALDRREASAYSQPVVPALVYFGPLVAWFRKSTAADCGRHRYSN